MEFARRPRDVDFHMQLDAHSSPDKRQFTPDLHVFVCSRLAITPLRQETRDGVACWGVLLCRARACDRLWLDVKSGPATNSAPITAAGPWHDTTVSQAGRVQALPANNRSPIVDRQDSGFLLISSLSGAFTAFAQQTRLPPAIATFKPRQWKRTRAATLAV